MTQSIIFNHHSLPCNSILETEGFVPVFLKTCLRANRLGLSLILLDESVDSSWFRIKLADNYFFQDWFAKNNNDQNKDLIRAFRSIQTNQPFFTSEDIGLELFDVTLREYPSKKFQALRAAAWHDAPITSFPTRTPWISSPIGVNVQTLNDDGALISSTKDIVNIHSLEVMLSLEPKLRERQQASINTGKEIIENHDRVFPSVILCDKAKEQLSSGIDCLLLEQIKTSFNCLSTFAEKWQEGIIEQYSHSALRDLGLNHEVSGESDSVLNSPKLRKYREFRLPTGEKKLFENHIKFKSKQFRLYFLPDVHEKVFYVGYIGSHLPL